MKKRVMALVMAGVMSMAVLAGCGGEEPAATTESAPAATTESAPADTATDAGTTASEAGLSFEDLQNNYAILVDVYNQVEELYMNDGIAQDDTVESLMAEAKGIIEEMGEATEADFPDDASKEEMNNAMATMIEGLGNVVDGMTVAEGGEEAPAAEAEADVDVTYDGGYYGNDGSSDFFLAFFTAADGTEFAYISDGTNEAYAEYEVGESTLEDGTVFPFVTIGDLSLGYFEGEDGETYLIDLSDGNTFVAAELSEEEAAAIVAALAE